VTPNEIIDGILRREGGYVDQKDDKGGATKFGITHATLAEWRGKPVTVDDVKNLTETEARELYREEYIIRPGFMGIENEAVRALVIDCAVNHGTNRAVKLLQEAARVFTDGIFGPNTRNAVNRMTASVLYRRLCAARVRLYGRIIFRDRSQAAFAAGWCNRVAEFIEGGP
jgi:lysozyme family protein